MRERVWRGVADGTVRAVVGARSALFLPFADLGLIVVDEEHDLAYKQEDRVFYNARDMAVVRGHLAGFPVVLSSATPSIESRVNADAGRYRRIVLSDRYRRGEAAGDRGDRHAREPAGARPLPVAAAGRRRSAETLAEKQQALLFLNRRGYAPLTLCRTCGHRFQCPNCSTWLVEHRFRGVLRLPPLRPLGAAAGHLPATAATTDSLVACGPGVERLAEEVGGALSRGADHRPVERHRRRGRSGCGSNSQAIAEGEVDIVIGTQLVAKGHNFPLLTLVGVVDGDLGLAFGDLRAAERTFQLLSPGDRPGRALGRREPGAAPDLSRRSIR